MTADSKQLNCIITILCTVSLQVLNILVNSCNYYTVPVLSCTRTVNKQTRTNTHTHTDTPTHTMIKLLAILAPPYYVLSADNWHNTQSKTAGLVTFYDTVSTWNGLHLFPIPWCLKPERGHFLSSTFLLFWDGTLAKIIMYSPEVEENNNNLVNILQHVTA